MVIVGRWAEIEGMCESQRRVKSRAEKTGQGGKDGDACTWVALFRKEPRSIE